MDDTEKIKKCLKSDKSKKKKVLSEKQKEVLAKNSFSQMDSERAAKLREKAGQATKERCEKLKQMGEWASFGLSRHQHKKDKTTSDDIESNDDLKTANLSNMAQIIFKQIDLARKGDTHAAIFLRDLIGEKPTDKQEINAIITEKPNKKKILQMMQKLDENPELEKELIGDEQTDR